jgi:hypothetical protein
MSIRANLRMLLSAHPAQQRAEGQDLGNIGGTYTRLGDLQKGIDYLRQRLALAQALGDRKAKRQPWTI